MIDDELIIITDRTLPLFVYLPEAIALYLESKAMVVDKPIFNQTLTADKQAIIGETLFAYLDFAHGQADIPEATSYISVVGKGTLRDFKQSKSDKIDGSVEILASAPFPEQAMEVAGSVYQIFRDQPGFCVPLLEKAGFKKRGLFIKKAWPKEGHPGFRQRSDDIYTFGFEVQVRYAVLDE